MLNVGIMDAIMINIVYICICIHSTNKKIPVLILYTYLKLSTADESKKPKNITMYITAITDR